ncbi:ABC transporter ATP-binding protein [Occultella glacieicola]|uniref:ABC transporter ATP-binding protein n=1 Tax=Occultella glacieicola TaxID=2518684 RepID=A0ABY2E7Z3_9MICO|nr:ABC transporter ATP-binding protein [Occultella glacieicola]TDE95956.1 ABC transporter ATP-binding protein [Occultella glacieicola]
MIEFRDVSVDYGNGPVLRGVDAVIGEGELCLVVGPTGSGKSSLLGAAGARVPHFSGGRLTGTVLVDGRDTREHLPRDLADVVGVVGQDPLASFVTDTVAEELAFAMEQLALAPTLMRRRVEEVLDLLGLAALRDRPLGDLSGGQQQRVAIGAVLTAQPRILVLDEPTSALDPAAAEDVLAALTRLVHDAGITVLLAEHRLERVVQFADAVISLTADGVATSGDPATVLAGSAVAPPVVELGRLAGWDPLPLSVRDARRTAGPLRERVLAGSSAAAGGPGSEGTTAEPGSFRSASAGRSAGRSAARSAADEPGTPTLTADGLHVRHGRAHAVRGVDLALAAGEVVALMGRNGAGKSSLLWALSGAGPRSAGTVRTAAGADPADQRPAVARRQVALVPQSPTDLLYLATVSAECAAADSQADAEPGSTARILGSITPGIDPGRHPRDLSEGQRLALAVAVQLAAAPAVLLLDEPTRGLDYPAKAELVAALAGLRRQGRTVLVASHDVEFVAQLADRVLLLADGEVVTDAPARDFLLDSPVFAPQVAKILAPAPVLTVADVRRALDAGAEPESAP